MTSGCLNLTLTSGIRDFFQNHGAKIRIFSRIFKVCPAPQHYPVPNLANLTVLTVYSCAIPHHTTQLVRDIRTDTIFVSNVKHDSVYLNHERFVDRSSDIVYIKDVSVEYKYRLLRDTVRIVEKYSIPYEVTVVKPQEITRPLTWYDHLTRLTIWLVIGSLLSLIVVKFRKYFSRP